MNLANPPATALILPAVAAFLERADAMPIGGRRVASASGSTFPVENPADGSRLTTVPLGDRVDVDRAVDAARKTYESGRWSTARPSARAKVLWRLADLIEDHSQELGQLITLENGKPIRDAVEGETGASAELIRYMAGWIGKLEGATIPTHVGGRFHNYTLRQPAGVVGQIIPWNYPLLMVAWKVAPALAAGCTVVLKPAEQTPLTALRIAELADEAGLPAGTLNVVTGNGEGAGAAIAAHPGIDKVAFTGSTEVGRKVLRASAGNLKRVSLELGGKSPNIVFADADRELSIRGAAEAIFTNAGQVCSAGSRLLVEEAVHDVIVTGVAEYAKRIRLGPGLSPASEMGPLISEEQLNRVLAHIEEGARAGAEVVTGGKRVGSTGYFVAPTLCTGVQEDMSLVRDEIFGPVVTVSSFDSLEDVVRLANSTSYGLGAGIWTRDISKAHALAAELTAGAIWINSYGSDDPAVPFGGLKESGWGRERGKEGVELYTVTKAVVTQLR